MVAAWLAAVAALRAATIEALPTATDDGGRDPMSPGGGSSSSSSRRRRLSGDDKQLKHTGPMMYTMVYEPLPQKKQPPPPPPPQPSPQPFGDENNPANVPASFFMAAKKADSSNNSSSSNKSGLTVSIAPAQKPFFPRSSSPSWDLPTWVVREETKMG